MTLPNQYTGTSVHQPTTGTLTISSNTAISPSKLMNQYEYEFFVEAKNLITDMAQDEELGAGYRDQAKRLITRLVMRKL